MKMKNIYHCGLDVAFENTEIRGSMVVCLSGIL